MVFLIFKISCLSELDSYMSLTFFKKSLFISSRPNFVKDILFKAEGIYHPCVQKLLGDETILNDIEMTND
jgi:DNA mismatch repair ATPase MutS